MFLKIQRTALSKHISIAQRALSQRSTMQILEGILLRAKDNFLYLISTDTEISISTKLSANIIKSGSCIVNGRLFGDIIKKMEGDVLDISVDGNVMKIKNEKSVFDLNVQTEEHFPELPKIDANSFKIEADILKDAIKKSVFATSTDETKIIFTGVLFKSSNGQIDVVSLDGFRLAKSNMKKDIDGVQAVLPARSLNELSKIIDEDVEVFIGKNQALFVSGETKFYTTLLNGQFYEYKDLIKTDGLHKLRINRAEFLSSIERASLLAREDGANLIKFEFCDDQLTITSNSMIGSVLEKIDCKMEGANITIAFNSRYMAEGIRIIDDEFLDLYYSDSLNPMIIKPSEDDSYTYLVLPVRLAQ